MYSGRLENEGLLGWLQKRCEQHRSTQEQNNLSAVRPVQRHQEDISIGVVKGLLAAYIYITLACDFGTLMNFFPP